MSDAVIDDDVNEAIRLVEKSRDSIKPGATPVSHTSVTPSDRISRIIGNMRSKMADKEMPLSIKEIKEMCSRAGFGGEQVDRCLDVYENMNVYSFNQNRTKLTFVV